MVVKPLKLPALVYDILPSTTAVFSYAIGSRKLSANEQFFVGAQTVVSLLQTTQIKQGVSFIAANKVYTSTNKTTNKLRRNSCLEFDTSHASLLSGFSGTEESLPVNMPDPIRTSDPDQLGSLGQKRAG